MNYSKYRFNLDMQSYISQVSLPVRQHDTGIILRINLTDGGVPYRIKDGCRAVFYARKADGNPLMNDCVIEKNTTICYELTQQTTACSGVVDCEVRLYGSDGNLITTPRFILVIDSRVVHDEDFPLSDSEQTVLDNIILSEQERIKAEEERERASAEALAKAERAGELVDELTERLKVEDIGDEELRLHNENTEAHTKAFDAHNNDLDAHSVIFGEGNVRGLKGYWIEAVAPNQNRIRLSPHTDRASVGAPVIYGILNGNNTIVTGYGVGDEFSIITPKDHYNLCGKITAIQNDLIYYELYTEIEWSAGDPLDNGDYSFCVPEKYNVGIVTISEGGLPTGFGTVAGGDYSTTSGAGGNAHGAFGDVGGLNTKAGYCGFARGSKNRADAKYSGIPAGFENKIGVKGLQGFIGGGNNNEVNGYSGSARNGKNKVDADYGDGSGFQNTIEKGANASSVSGQYNTIKEGAHSVNGGGYNNTVYGTGFAGFISGIVNWLKSKAGYVGGEDCQSSEAWYQFLHGQGLRAGNKLAQALFGRFNKVNDDAVFQVGNGVLDEARSNAFEIISTRDENGTNHVSMKLGDNFEVKPDGTILTPYGSPVHMVTGSYVGTGGAVTLTFDVVPDAIIVPQGNFVFIFPKIGIGYYYFNDGFCAFSVSLKDNNSIAFCPIINNSGYANYFLGQLNVVYHYYALYSKTPINQEVETVSITINKYAENGTQFTGNAGYETHIVKKGTTWAELAEYNDSKNLYVNDEYGVGATTGKVYWVTSSDSLSTNAGYIQNSEGTYMLGTDLVTEGIYTCKTVGAVPLD